MPKPNCGVPLIILLLLVVMQARPQSYHAFSGSSYTGVTAIYNNPASSVNQAYKWDVSLLGIQATLSNTAVLLNNSSLLLPANSKLTLLNDLRQRWLHANADINLLNLRYAINIKNAVSLGVRLRSYNHLKATPFNYSDSITSLNGFLSANNNVNFLSGYAVHAGWQEVNFNYAHTFLQSATSTFSAGITLSYLKSLSGAFGQISHVSYSQEKSDAGYNYFINQGAITMEYSANYVGDKPGQQSLHNFLSNALTGAGFDVGAEYLFKADGNDNGKPVAANNYDWKIGISIMDIGRNKFKPVDGAFTSSGPLGITDSVLRHRINPVRNIQQLRDSFSTQFAAFTPLHNNFYISLPTRLLINIDHALGNNFFVNGELSLNFYSTSPAANLHTRELNLLTITPRWETPTWGVYLPVQYNTQGQLWVGAAAKLGPLLVGMHSLDFINWFKTGQQLYNGGFYMLLSVHPFKGGEHKINTLDCPR